MGESLIGVALAFVVAASVTSGGSDAPLALNLQNWGTASEVLGLIAFVIGAVVFVLRTVKTKN